MPITQQRNAEMVSLLSADFQKRYEPNFALGQAISTILALPGLRGFWPMSSVGDGGAAIDISGQVRHLTYNGSMTYLASGMPPNINMDGVGDFLTRSDEVGLSITGTETYIYSPQQGLTLGGWFYLNNLNEKGLMSKYVDIGNQASYMLYYSSVGGGIHFLVSIDGTTIIGSPTILVVTGRWYFLVGNFDPSTEVNIFIGTGGVMTKYSTVAAVPASIFDSTAPFEIGAYNNGNFSLNGAASMCFLCAADVPDAIIRNVFHQTRAMYGQ